MKISAGLASLAMLLIGTAACSRDTTAVSTTGMASPPDELSGLSVDLCESPPQNTIDSTFLPDLGANSTIPAGSTQGVSSQDLASAVGILASDSTYGSLVATEDGVVRLADPAQPGLSEHTLVTLTVEFPAAVDMPAEDDALVPADGNVPPEASEIEVDEGGMPVTTEAEDGAFIFEAVRLAWFSIDLTESLVLHVEATASADYSPCPWDPAAGES
jgi:hypothetical protein